MLRIFCLLTGDDYNLARNDTPASKRKIELYATCLFIPVILWFVNTTLLVNKVLANPLGVAIVSGAIVASIIFLIERAIIMSNGNKVIVAFRIMLGLIVAFLGAISIDEVLFESDINQQMELNKEATRQKEISAVESHYRGLLEKKRSEVELLYNDWQRSKDHAYNEMIGGPGSSGRRGRGNIAEANIDQPPAVTPMLSSFFFPFRHWQPVVGSMSLVPVVGMPESCVA